MKRLSKTVFRAYDIRGLIDQEISTEFAFNLGAALANHWVETCPTASPHVVVGYDARQSSPKLAHALMEGFAKSKWKAQSLGLVPTPCVYFASVVSENPFGIMVTGSHNPPEFNGFKMSVRGNALDSEEIQKIYHRMHNTWFSYRSSNAHFPTSPISQTYLKFLLDDFQKQIPRKLKKLKIVVDSGNGAAGPISTELYKLTGHEIIPLFETPDGTFPNHHPDPSDERTLETLQNTVQRTKADLGFAFDGDGDRLGVVTPSGQIVYGDQLLALFSLNLQLKNESPRVITEVKASQSLLNYLREKNIEVMLWKTGHSLIKKRMKEINAHLAGEMSGHFFFADRYFGFDDALYAGLRLIEWAQNGHDIENFLKNLPHYVATPEIRMNCPDHKKFELVDKVRRHFESQFEVNSIDGARITFSHSRWGLVRASNTQPALVLRFEAEDLSSLKKIQTDVESVISRYIE